MLMEQNINKPHLQLILFFGITTEIAEDLMFYLEHLTTYYITLLNRS